MHCICEYDGFQNVQQPNYRRKLKFLQSKIVQLFFGNSHMEHVQLLWTNMANLAIECLK